MKREPAKQWPVLAGPHPVTPRQIGEHIGFALGRRSLRADVFVLARLMMSRSHIAADERHPFDFWRGIWLTLLWTVPDAQRDRASACLRGTAMEGLI